MCWNKEISLNTFLFSAFMLTLIIYNNKYTQYKIKLLNNGWIYLFIMSFIIIQLIEYFIWKNIKNPYYNSVFTIIAGFVFLIQPICSLMILSDKTLRNRLIICYLILAIPFAIYTLSSKRMYASVSPLGHIHYHLLFNEFIPVFTIWTCFFLFPFFYERYYYGFFLFGIGTLFLMMYTYFRDDSVGSMWCWIVNTIMIYYAFILLFYLPFFEKGKLCH